MAPFYLVSYPRNTHLERLVCTKEPSKNVLSIITLASPGSVAYRLQKNSATASTIRQVAGTPIFVHLLPGLL
jgi:hypothetical protein